MFDNSKIGDSNPMKPQLRREGCEFTMMKKVKEKDSKGKEYEAVILTFVDPITKSAVSLKEFKPKGKLETMTEEEYKKSIGLSISRLAHAVRAFITEEKFLAIKVTRDPNSMVQADIEANWDEYVRGCASALGVASGVYVPMVAKGVKCALKVVYNETKGKYYSGFPKVPPFISTETHPKDFVINPKYDIFEIPSDNAPKPDIENKSPNGSTKPVEDAAFGTSPAATADTGHDSDF